MGQWFIKLSAIQAGLVRLRYVNVGVKFPGSVVTVFLVPPHGKNFLNVGGGLNVFRITEPDKLRHFFIRTEYLVISPTVLFVTRQGIAGIDNSRKKVIQIEKVRHMQMNIEATERERLFYFR